MGKRRDRAHPGETGHAEGQHGAKTHRAFMDQLKSGARAEVESTPMRSTEGRHRLAEDRDQRDEADKNSEANRKRAEVNRGRLDENLPGVGDKIHGDAGH